MQGSGTCTRAMHYKALVVMIEAVDAVLLVDAILLLVRDVSATHPRVHVHACLQCTGLQQTCSRTSFTAAANVNGL